MGGGKNNNTVSIINTEIKIKDKLYMVDNNNNNDDRYNIQPSSNNAIIRPTPSAPQPPLVYKPPIAPLTFQPNQQVFSSQPLLPNQQIFPGKLVLPNNTFRTAQGDQLEVKLDNHWRLNRKGKAYYYDFNYGYYTYKNILRKK